MRATLHDLANTLSGIRGILELNDPMRPLSPRDRLRLDAVLSEGMTILERSRHLTMETLPEATPEAGVDWRARMEQCLQPLSTIHRCSVTLEHGGDPSHDQWPGELLRGFITAVTRQLLPYVRTGSCRIGFAADAHTWQVTWDPAPVLPDSLDPGKEVRARDISARWVIAVNNALRVTVSQEQGTVIARIPRA